MLLQFSIYISIYAAHLYDSVMLYSKALDLMINERLEKNELVDISELARDGETNETTRRIFHIGFNVS